MLLLLLACQDYELTPKTDAVAGDLPQLVVDPEFVAAPACSLLQTDVLLENVGGAELTITALDITEPWTIEDMELPLTLGVGETVRVNVEGAVDTQAELTIESDDPDMPTWVVPLEALVDQPPEVTLDSPSEGDIIDPATPFPLEATVVDDVDGELPVSWVSDLDGLLAAETSSAGFANAAWSTGRTVGDHLVTVYATDRCGNEVSDDALVCANGGYTEDELDISTWHFEGSAVWDSNSTTVVLTEAVQNQVGSAFQTSQTVSGDAVTIRFSFYQGDGSGADGLSLTALDTSRMTGFLGGTGCGIGYGGDADCTGGPALPGWSIEVDTYYNSIDPTADDHVMFTFDGDVDDPAAWAALPEMEDTGWHTMEVEVAAPHVRVTIDGTVYIDQDLSGHFAFPAYVGFTAGTGGATNKHAIDSLEVTGEVCE